MEGEAMREDGFRAAHAADADDEDEGPELLPDHEDEEDTSNDEPEE